MSNFSGDPLFEKRPWGEFYVLEDLPTHKVKRLVVHPDKQLSYQRHQKRTEHWVVVGGCATVVKDGVVTTHECGETVDIPCGTKHRLANHGDKMLVVIEIQRGDYFGEDDIERFEDDFGRI